MSLNFTDWVEVGSAIGEWVQENTGFSDWWYDWNGQLDDAFFNWLDQEFSNGGMGDFPIQPSDQAYV